MAKSSTLKITPAVLRFWIDQRLNVIFEGRHGVGKTAMVKEAFESAGLKWKYFSAATMDPWCDFVGIPRAVSRDGREVLEYVMPQDFADDTVEAIFFDEFNRSHKKVRDAVMELIQFKSINGRQFKNLRVVWAAINPKEDKESESKYMVDELDPAILDRFQIHVTVPFVPDRKYFESHYGDEGASAVDWWHELPKDAAKDVAPRRLEYGLQVLLAGGNTGYVFPTTTMATTFAKAIKNGSVSQLIRKMFTERDKVSAETFLKDANNIDAVTHLIKEKGALPMAKFYLPMYPAEKLTTIITKSLRLLKWAVDNETGSPSFTTALDSIVSANQNRKMVDYIIKNRPMSAGSVCSVLKSLMSRVKTGASTTQRIAALKYVADNLALITAPDSQELAGDIVVCFIARSQASTLRQAKVRKYINTILAAKIIPAITDKAIRNGYNAIGIKL